MTTRATPSLTPHDSITRPEREQAIEKIIRYLGWGFLGPDPEATVTAYTSDLSDAQLSALKRLAGIAAKYGSEATGTSNAYTLACAINNRMTFLPMMLDSVSLITEETNFDSMSVAIQIMMDCGRDINSHPEHWAAHCLALSTYDPLDMGDHWTYRENKKLVALIDSRPEDVDAILRLRETFQLGALTEEMLDEYKSAHSAVSHGWL